MVPVKVRSGRYDVRDRHPLGLQEVPGLSRKTEIQVGATVIVSLVVLIAGVAWLKEWTFQHDTHVYRISFPTPVQPAPPEA